MKKFVSGRLLIIFLSVIFLSYFAPAFAVEQKEDVSIGSLGLTTEQINTLGGLLEECRKKQYETLDRIKSKYIEIRSEIRNEERLKTKTREERSVRKVNSLVKDIAKLYAKLLRTRVEYILKAKNVLTRDQKDMIIANLEFIDESYTDELPAFFDIDMIEASVDLTGDQVKKILKNNTDMEIKALKLELEIDLNVLDLQEELLREDADSANVDKIILKITDIGNKLMINRVDYFLKNKDVLTMDQRKLLLDSFIM